jgi:hypothetical protein
VTLAPVCLPYSPEFAPEQPGRGAAALAQIATTSGGKERIEIPQTWAELQVRPHYIEIVPWLLIAAVCLFLLEVFERRTGWVSRLFARQKVVAVAGVPADETATPAPVREPEHPLKRFARRRKQQPAPRPMSATSAARPQMKGEVPPPKSVSPQTESADSSFDALRKARERADRRTKRE